MNAELTPLYWDIGDRIRKGILGEERAGYAERVVATLARELTREYGRGFGRANLFNMIRFAEVFPDRQTVQTLFG